MSNWPDSPLIRITSGSLWGGVPLHGVLASSAGLAASGTSPKYRIIQGPGTGQLIRRDDPDSGTIIAWEDVVLVPADSLERLRDEFRGAALSERRLDSLLQVTSHLAPAKLSPMGKAVSRVEEAMSGVLTLLDTSSEEYLSLLLGALSDFQGLENDLANRETERTLSRIVSLCVEWIAEVTPKGSPVGERSGLAVLGEVQERAESDPAIGGFPAMVGLAGNAAEWVAEGWETEEERERLVLGLREPVLTLAHYALALLAEGLRRGGGE
jgi:hypothetical protein